MSNDKKKEPVTDSTPKARKPRNVRLAEIAKEGKWDQPTTPATTHRRPWDHSKKYS